MAKYGEGADGVGQLRHIEDRFRENALVELHRIRVDISPAEYVVPRDPRAV
ncbi:hypothetical protein WAI453_002229 [Rhynchosporium graminicola]